MNLPTSKFHTGLCALGLSFLLSACGGGGGNAGTPVLGSSGAASSAAGAASAVSAAATPASVELIANAVQLPSGGDQLLITATVKGAGNVSLPSTALTFSSDSGTLTSAQSSTDATGAATVILTAGTDRSNRNIVVTATSGSVSGNITLPVVGTTLSYSGVTTVALGASVQSTLTAKDSKGTVIPNLPVTVTSSLGNAVSAATVTTDLSGIASVGYTATRAGTDTLTFAAGGATVKTSISISGENFAFVTPPPGTTVAVGLRQPLTLQYLSGGVAQTAKQIAFSATAGKLTLADPASVTPCASTTAIATVTTDSQGKAMVCASSATASPATVQATLLGGGATTAQATLSLLFVATTPAKLVLQASPTALSPNPAGLTTQAASVQATVTDISGNPVSGVTVAFNRCADPSGGNLSQASAITSSSGQATVQYIAGGSSTASNGVLLQATVQGFPSIDVAACAAGANNTTGTNNTASLTVSQSALFIALGTGNTVTELDTQTYQKDWVVYVTDANGVPVSNVNLTIKALPVYFGKGQLFFSKVWSWSQTPVAGTVGITGEGDYVCRNEDVNYNGVLDVSSNPSEDFNGDNKLEPGNVISVTSSSTTGGSTGTFTTGSTGRATISLVYAKSYATWVKVQLVASAVVSGTESKTESTFWAAGAAKDYTDQNVAPPGQFSPFGTGSPTSSGATGCNSPN